MLYATTFNYCGFEIKAAQDDEGLEYIAEQTISVFTRNEKRLFRLRDFLKAKSTKTILGESYTCAKKLDNTDKNKKKQNSFSSYIFIKASPIFFKALNAFILA